MTNEYISAFLYGLLGFFYIIFTNVKLPGNIYGFLMQHHKFIYLFIGTIYFLVSIIHIKNTEDSKKELKDKTNMKSLDINVKNYNNIIIAIIGLFLLYVWINLFSTYF